MNVQFAAAFAIGTGVIGTGIGVGLASGLGLLAMGRNPSAGNQIRTNMILGMVFAEAIAIYALVVAMIILFVPIAKV
jgi:F-type H+-transporting ATPase subunit c